MKITAWLLVVAALAVLGSLGGLLLSSAERTPQNLLESAVRRTLQGDPDYDAALEELKQAFRMALQNEDRELIGDILLHQGRVYRRLGALDRARGDLETVIEEYRPGDKVVEMELVAIDIAAEDYPAALERANDVLQRDPTFTLAWTYRGQVLRSLAQRLIDRSEEALRSVVSAEDADRALELVQRIAGRDTSDPLRVAMLHELRGFFELDEELQAREVLGYVDDASEAISGARESFAHSFSGQLSRDSVGEYMRLLKATGRPLDAIDFGLAVVHHNAARSSPETMRLIMESLTEAGRAGQAATLVEKFLGRKAFPDQDFYRSFCHTLYQAERWQNLLFFALQMRRMGDQDHQAMGNFYVGLALYKIGNHLESRIAFERFTRDKTYEPFRGALAMAWGLLALTTAELGDDFTEHTALRAALQLDPDGNGELWLRQAEVLEATEKSTFREAERALAHAIRLLPERVDELEPRWRSLGESALRIAGVQVESLRADLRDQRLFTPPTPTGPYELFRLAELHREYGEPAGVEHASQRILDDYPGFTPAMNLLIPALLRLEKYDEVAEVLLERLELLGDDLNTVRRLIRLPEGTLDSSQILRLMRLNPHFTGRLMVAQTLRDEGRREQALNGLVSLGLESLGVEGLLLAGELMLEGGEYRQTISTLRGVNKGSAEYADAFPMRLLAALGLGDGGLMWAILQEPVRADQLNTERLLPVAEQFLLRGFPKQARLLLQRLDEFPETRSGSGLLKLAATAQLQGERALFSECLDRADAFDLGERPDFGRMLLAILDESWGTLPQQMSALSEYLPSPSLQHDAAVALLDERIDEARQLITLGERQDPDDPLWHLLDHCASVLRAEVVVPHASFGEENQAETLFALNGLGSGKRDPRPLLAHIAALELDDWDLWSVVRLQELAQSEVGALWPSYLSARGYIRLGQREEGLERIQETIERWPTFAPAWDLLERVEFERLGRIDHIDLVRLRHRRRIVLGSRPGEEAEERLTQAWAAESAGSLERAVRTAREAVSYDPDFLPARFKLAQLHRARENYGASIKAYQEAFAIAPEEHALELAQEFLAVLEEAHERDPDRFPRPLIQAELESLARQLPNDPLVALSIAEERLNAPGISPALAVASAYDRLDRFRANTSDVPLESLREGATLAWKEFYTRLDPVRAETFARKELEMRPGSLDLWTLLGETLEAQGRFSEAIELYETVQSMVPDERGKRRIASLLALTSGERERVEANLAEAQDLAGLEAPDDEMQLIRARSIFHAEDDEDSDNQSAAIEIMAALWDHRDDADGTVEVSVIAQVYGTMLVQRSEAADRELSALLLNTAADAAEDSTRRNLLIALAHLGEQIPIRRRRRQP